MCADLWLQCANYAHSWLSLRRTDTSGLWGQVTEHLNNRAGFAFETLEKSNMIFFFSESDNTQHFYEWAHFHLKRNRSRSVCTEWRFTSEGRRVAACLCAALDLVLTSSASLAEYSIHETKACCWIPLHKKSGNRLEQMNAKEHRLRGLERKAEQKKKIESMIRFMGVFPTEPSSSIILAWT